jgi:hypothetical protein
MKKMFIFVVALFIWNAPSQSEEAQKPGLAKSPSQTAPAATTQKTPGSDTITANKNTAAASAAPSVADSVKGKFAKLSIQSQPDSAGIVIDSIEKGVTPARLDSILPGPHVILIKKKGYFAKKISTTLLPDSTYEISTALVRPGCINVKSDPAGATLFLDNKKTGTTPFENTKIKPGNYTLRLELTNYEPIERPIIVAETGCDTISIGLQFSKTYADSIDRVKKDAIEKKRKFKKIVDYIAAGAFLVFGAVICLIEAGNAK